MRASLMRLLVAALLGAAGVGAVQAQWAWRDDNGRLVFSDRQPPASVKPENIVRQPGQSAAARPTEAPAASDAGKGVRTAAEREMEFRKRQAERAEAEKKQAEEPTNTARRSADCERARGYLRSLEDGARLVRTDAQGNREFLDDNQRAAETTRAREAVTRSCSG
jgi:Domain of unknown function (DUF4124)